ncbi:non-ribosomal peptide synthetase [Rhodococcus sp. ACPA1]|uniref:non-ribosomal peptide synthetase n=1 Tax=Rhodococcus sp. ACPA1 TaxID=2028572 RepID=UPI000BB14A0A|nr:non-ribosomal peptide synthetase [Rhodococcus sp. ACPA1]PBC54245.1 non-ribosomal peptide synthetase [Rhodococcus sp. ACPA1]
MSPDHSAAARSQRTSAEGTSHSARVSSTSVAFPVTAAQSEVWVGQQLNPGSPVYNLSLVVEVAGRIDLDRAAAAIRKTAERAEALHVRFERGDDNELLQVPTAPDAWTLAVVDLRGEVDPDASARAWMDRDMETVVDIDCGEPLFRHALLRTGDESVIWYQRYHHSLIDGYGITLLVADVVDRYEHPELETSTAPWPLDTLVTSDRDYRASARFESDRDFWIQQVIDAPEPPRLLPQVVDHSGSPISALVEIDGDDADAIYTFASDAGIRRTRLPLAAVVAYIHRFTGRRDLTLSLPMTARVGRELRRIPGMCSTILPLRVQVDPAMTVGELATRIDTTLISVLRHGRYRGEDLARDLRSIDPDRQIFGPGINSMMFEHSLTFGGFPAWVRGSATGPVRDLDFSIRGGQDSEPIQIDLRAPAGLGAELEEHRRRLEHFVGQFVADPSQPIASLDPMTEAERRQLLVEFNDTASPQESVTVPDLFHAQVSRTPDAEALIADDIRLTYRELGKRVAQLSHHLRARGVEAETVVAVGLPRSAEMVIGLLAVMCSGGAFVPLDPSWPEDRRTSVLADAGAALVLTGPGGVTDAGERAVPVDLAAWAYAEQSAEPPAVTVQGSRLAYVIFTSGSTGRPKGAMIRHEAVCARLLWQRDEILGFGADDASLFKAPLSFDISVNEILLPLVAGGRLVVAEPGGERDPQYLLDLIARESVTFVYLVSSMLDVLLDLSRGTDRLAALKHVWCGGEVLTPGLFERFRSQLAITLYHGYGPAEATIGVSHVIYREDAARIATSIGRPNPNTQLYVLDEHLNPVPLGTGGELYAGGFLLGRGYVDAPGLTASRFVANPFANDGSRLYRTGDLARWAADGSLDFLGRADNQVKIRGMRLELEDVEAGIVSHPAVRHSAVVVRETPLGAKFLAAYVVAKQDSVPDVAELRVWASSKLPEYMVPSAFVVLDRFPLTPNGKLDRRALPEPDLGAAGENVAPRTAAEETLCGLMAGVLGVESVGVTDDFFALGGDSIVAIQLVNHARQEGLSISPREIFQLRTAEALARVQDGRTAAAVDSDDVAVGDIRSTPIVARTAERGGGIAAFHQSVLVQTPAALDEHAAAAALAAVLERHDALRATLVRGNGSGLRRGGDRWTLSVPAPSPAAVDGILRVVEFDGSAEQLDIETRAAVGRLDPDAGVMVQAVLFAAADGPGRLLLIGHHLVVDGVSWRIILEDLARAGTAVAAGGVPELAPVGTSLRRWSELLDEQTRSGAFDHELSFWADAATTEDPLLGSRALDLALDLAGDAETLTVTLPPEVTRPLLSTVPAAFHGHVNDALLTGVAVALQRWRDGEPGPVLLDLEGHGREEDLVRRSDGPALDLSRTVGWFTTVYPVVLDPGAAADEAGIADALKAVKDQLRRIPGSGFGYGALRYVGVPRPELALAPTPQVLFNYLGRVTSAEGVDWLPRAMGGADDPRMPLGHALAFDVIAEDGADGPVLRTTLTWAPGVLTRDAVVALADEWTAVLRVLAGIDRLGGHTPSDFPLVSLTQPDADALAGAADVLPLTPLQEGIYFQSAFEDTGTDPYVVQQVIELTGPVDAAALHRGLQAVVDRHAALRVGVRAVSDGRVVQVVGENVQVPMEVLDLTGVADPEQRVEQVLAADRARGFDFERGPLLRYTLARVKHQKFLLLQSIHHIVADGWSVPVMLRELMALYNVEGKPLALPTPTPYRSYLEWLGARDRQASLAVWREALADAPEPVELPKPSSTGESGIRSVRVTLPSDATVALSAVGRARGLTLSTLVHGTCGLVLGRLTGREDVVFGSTVSGRGGDLPGIETMVGLFINTVPTRLRYRPTDTVAETLARWQHEQSTLLDHQYLGLPELRREAGLQNLFETLVVFENYPLGDGAVADPTGAVRLTGIRFDEHPPYPMTLIVVPGDALTLELKYDATRIDAATATRFAESTVAYLAELTRDVDQNVSSVALASREPIDAALRDVAVEFPETTVTALLEEQAARTPDAVAVVFEDEHLTYAELHARANRVARLLVDRGVAPESKVAVALPRSLDLMVALLAVGKAGGAYVPLDTGYPADRLAFMLEDAEPVCVLTDGTVPFSGSGVPQVRVSDADRYSPAPLTGVALVPQHPAYVIYTSGSTGRPKGVVVPHAGIVNRLLWVQRFRPITPTDNVFQKTPSSFDVSVLEFFGPLLAGATLVLARPDGHKDPAYLADVIVRQSITRVHFVPSMLEVFLAEPAAARCTGLRIISCSGEALPVASARRVAELLPGVELDNLYGPTEASVDVSYAASVQGIDASAPSVPIGLPTSNTGLYVLDRYLQPVPAGAAGELYLSGPQLARGYLGRPGLSAERFVADPFSHTGSRMYRTGDVARVNAEGAVEYLGRVDDQVKLRGFRIELGEIEAQMAACPGVRQAAAVVRSDRPGQQQLVGYVVGDADDDDVRARLAAALPEFMVPVALVHVPEFPVGPSGKLDRAALPAPDFSAHTSSGQATSAPVEESGPAGVLAAHYAEILGLGTVGVNDDFFALGGDSILAIRLVNLARREGITVTPRQIFEQRTPAALARLVAATVVAPAPRVEESGTGVLPPLPVVHRLSEWSGGKNRFNQAVLLHTPAGTSATVLTAALHSVIGHHDGLRQKLTRHAPGVWSLEITESADLELRRVDVTGLDAAALRETVAAESDAATDRLDPDDGTMLSAVWFDAGPQELGRLLLVAHHLVIDGVSWRTLIEDLAMAWVAADSGQDAALDAVPTSLRGFARIVTEQAQDPARLAELDHWLRVTEPGADLVADTDGHAVVSSGARRTVLLDPQLTTALLTTVPAVVGADVTDVLLAALRLSADRWFAGRGRENDLLVDLERHGREELAEGVDLSRTVGWITNVTPVRLRSRTGALETLGDVKEQLRGAPDGGIGYGMLRYVNARTAGLLAARAESQVLFNYLGRMPHAVPGPWTPAVESDSLATDPDADLGGPYRLVINALCEESERGTELQAVFAWSDADLSEADVVALSDGWVSALRELADAAGEHDGPAMLTPSDLPLVTLTQEEIDRIVEASPSGVDTVLPLSPLQEGLYFQAGFDSGADIYTAQFSLDFAHRLDTDRLAAALRTLQRRNPTLRAGFVSAGLPAPVQFFGAGLDVPIAEFDLRELDEPERASYAEQLTAQDRLTPFDLTSPPLWRAMVLRLGDSHDRLVINRQFLLWDGWSNGLVVSQLLALYESGGDDSGFASPEGSFEDYLQWLAARDSDAAQSAWTGALGGLDEPTLLAATVAGAPQPPQRRDAVLSEELSERLRAGARGAGVTFNAVLNAALAVVLGIETGRRDLVFGTTVAGRPPEVPGIDAVAGMFLNTVPVRTTLRADETVTDLLRRIQSERLELTPYDYLGLASIQRVSEHRQLFDVLYVLQNFVDEKQVSALNAAHDISGGDSIDHTHYPVTVVVTPGASVKVKFEFHPEKISESRVERMLSRYLTVLEEWSTDLSGLVGGIAGAATPVPFERKVLPDRTIADLFADAARLRPDETALVFGHRTVSYAELDADVNRMARLLLGHGAGPERIVALALPRSVEMVVALFAVLRTGSAYLPLELDHPAERLVAMLDDARPTVLVTTSDVAGTLAAATIDTLAVDTLDFGAVASGPLSEAELGGFAPGTPGRLDHPAYVIYTSGSTGKPKGVVTPYRGLTNMQFNHREAIFEPVVTAAGGRRLRIAHTVSFAFDMSWEELLWLVEGHEVHICDENLRRDAEALVAYCDTHAIDVVNVTPTYAQHLVEEGLLDDGPGRHRPPLVLLGGEAVPDSVWNRLRDTDGTVGYNLYGPTEYTINTLGAGTADSATPTVGTPIWNTSAYVLDAWLRPVPDGVPGELYISGVGLARGYLDRFALTAERFVADPFRESVRMYRTGDLVRRRGDGNLDFLGRTDDQVKIRGHRVELGEIASALEALDDVRQAAVVVDSGPGGFKRLVGYAVPVSTCQPRDVDKYSQALRATLPDYMVPAAVIEVDSLPMTVNGKLDVKALPSADDVLGRSGGARTEPRTDTERVLSGLFGEILGVPAPGVDDDFFDLGGHSLLATRLISRARAALDTDLTMRDLFEAPTVAELAARIGDDTGSTRPVLVARPRPEHLPLSAAQQRLWLLQQMEGASVRDGAGPAVAYNFPIVLRLQAALDPGLFEQALTDVVSRHESLRTVFGEHDGEPVQVILDDARPDVAVVDGTEADLVRLVTETVGRPFDLATQIPVRASLIRVADEQVLAIVLHHIATDEWSDRPFLRDLMTAYAARAQGSAPEWEPLDVQYADYTLWQRDVLGDPQDPFSLVSRQLEYWAKTLDGAPEELVLPTDRTRPARPSFAGGAIETTLDAATTRALRSLARTSGTSMFMVLHAASAALLHRLGAGDDLPIGAPVAGRSEQGLDDLIGFFVNTVVLRTDVSGNPTFDQLLARVRDTDLAAFSHTDVPFETVVEKVNPARTLARNPLFQVMVGYHSRTSDSALVPGSALTPVAFEERTAKFDLVFNFTEYLDDDRVELRLEYGSDLFDRATAEKIARRQVVVLDALASDSGRAVGDLDVFLGDERELVVCGFNDTAQPVAEETFYQAFARHVAATPDAVAVVDDDGEVTYADLSVRADRIAALLHRRGVSVEDVVGLAVPRSAQMVAVVLGVQKLGAAYLPLDLNHPSDRISYMLADSAARVLVTTVGESTRIADVAGLTRILLDDASVVTELETGPALEVPQPSQGLDHAAYVIYTSGSTGKPKGAILTHDGIPSLVATAEQRMKLVPGSVVMQFASIGFDVAVFELSMALCTGSRLVIVPDESRVAGPELTDFMAAHAVTHAIIPPSLLAALPSGCAVPEGCTVLVGTETVPPELIGRWAERLNLLAAYGLTEATVNNTLWQAQPGWNSAVPIGIPDPNEQAYVLDDRLQPVPPGVAGELYIAGRGLARGYLGRPDLTSARFVPSPFGDAGTRMYRTGDRARWRADGNIDFLGRVDDQVKIRGFRIELGEIIAALGSHPAVKQSAVVADRSGDIVRLVGYVTPADGHGAGQIDPQAVREHAAARLPDYMVPTLVVVLDGDLPLTPNGKLDRKALPLPDWSALTGDGTPQTPEQKEIAAAFADILHLPSVGIHDNFFDLGGNSMASMRLVGRIRGRFAVDIGIRDVFDSSTVAELAAIVAGASSTGRPVLTAADPRPEALPLSGPQRRFWKQFRAAGAEARASHALSLQLRDTVDVEILAQALDDVTSRHEPLRTVYVQVGDTVVAQEAVRPALELVDVGDGDVHRTVFELAQEPLDLTEQAPLRVHLVTGADGTQALLLAMHYIAVDEWSVVPLLGDLMGAYAARSHGEEPAWEPLPVGYADYVVWSQALVGDPEDPDSRRSRQLGYWRETLDGMPSRLDLPAPAVRGPRTAEIVPVEIDAELHSAARKFASDTGTSLFMVLQAALATVLTRHGAGTNIPLGSLVAGRTEEALDALVGCFFNIVLLRTDTSGDPDPVELLRRIRTANLDALDNQDVAFADVVEAVGETPVLRPQIMLVHHEQARLGHLDALGGVMPVPVGVPDSDLTLSFYEPIGDGPVHAYFSFSSDVLDAETVRGWASELSSLVTVWAEGSR